MPPDLLLGLFRNGTDAARPARAARATRGADERDARAVTRRRRGGPRQGEEAPRETDRLPIDRHLPAHVPFAGEHFTGGARGRPVRPDSGEKLTRFPFQHETIAAVLSLCLVDEKWRRSFRQVADAESRARRCTLRKVLRAGAAERRLARAERAIRRSFRPFITNEAVVMAKWSPLDLHLEIRASDPLSLMTALFSLSLRFPLSAPSFVGSFVVQINKKN